LNQLWELKGQEEGDSTAPELFDQSLLGFQLLEALAQPLLKQDLHIHAHFGVAADHDRRILLLNQALELLTVCLQQSLDVIVLLQATLLASTEGYLEVGNNLSNTFLLSLLSTLLSD